MPMFMLLVLLLIAGGTIIFSILNQKSAYNKGYAAGIVKGKKIALRRAKRYNSEVYRALRKLLIED